MAGGAATGLADHAWSSIIPLIQPHKLTDSLRKIGAYIDNDNSAVLQAEAHKSGAIKFPN